MELLSPVFVSTIIAFITLRFDVIDKLVGQDGHACGALGFVLGICALIARTTFDIIIMSKLYSSIRPSMDRWIATFYFRQRTS